jgi:hypothetical protein
MSIVARKFSACPVRTAVNTWETIIQVIASDDSVKTELEKVTGIAASIISDGAPANNPITIIGGGPRLRLYCLYEEDGSTEDANESSLNWKLFEGDWEVHFPVEKDDFEWMSKSLAEKGVRFKTYLAGTKINEENSSKSEAVSKLTINLDKLKSNV